LEYEWLGAALLIIILFGVFPGAVLYAYYLYLAYTYSPKRKAEEES